MLPVGSGQDNPLLIFLRDHITHVVATTKYEAPFQGYSYIEPLGSGGDNYEIGRIRVNPTIRDGKIILGYTIGNDDFNCASSAVTVSNLDKKTFTLSDASFIKEGGGDRVECIDAAGKYIDDRKVVSRSGGVVVLDEPIINVVTIRLKISRLAIIMDGFDDEIHSGQVITNGWYPYAKFKDSSMSYLAETQVIVS